MAAETQAKALPRTLIIGAAGFVGGYLVRELENAGHSVTAVDIPQINLLDKESVEHWIETSHPDYVVNLAAISSVGASWKNPVQTVEVNVRGTLHLLDAVQKFAPGAKTLLIGSAEEYARKDSPINEDDPLEASNPYGITKIAQENFAELYRKKYGMKIVCTRSFNHTGVGQTTAFAIPSFVKQVADIFKSGHPGEIKVGNLSAIRDFSDVKDVVRVYRLLLENENKFNVYNVGSGIANKLSDLLDYIVSLAEMEIKISTDPEKFRPVDLPYQCADNSRIKELGYWNATDIHETLKWMFDNEMKSGH
ncbi:MAG: GDP-mannose 4,6-dehydratase [Fibrobacter sp.]|nr:GDP-mannose 4,6-dehydratase [Fibrobacter sp.]